MHFKSKMEANVYRYYKFIQRKYGKITGIEYEPEIFFLGNNPYGISSYVPDIKVTTPKNVYYVEVKGFVDDTSVKKAKAFSQKYPRLKLFFVCDRQYQIIQRLYARNIPYWEF